MREKKKKNKKVKRALSAACCARRSCFIKKNNNCDWLLVAHSRYSTRPSARWKKRNIDDAAHRAQAAQPRLCLGSVDPPCQELRAGFPELRGCGLRSDGCGRKLEPPMPGQPSMGRGLCARPKRVFLPHGQGLGKSQRSTCCSTLRNICVASRASLLS